MISVNVVIKIDIDEEIADTQEVISEMDYSMIHPAIKRTEIVDVLED